MDFTLLAEVRVLHCGELFLTTTICVCAQVFKVSSAMFFFTSAVLPVPACSCHGVAQSVVCLAAAGHHLDLNRPHQGRQVCHRSRRHLSLSDERFVPVQVLAAAAAGVRFHSRAAAVARGAGLRWPDYVSGLIELELGRPLAHLASLAESVAADPATGQHDRPADHPAQGAQVPIARGECSEHFIQLPPHYHSVSVLAACLQMRAAQQQEQIGAVTDNVR
jgi:hypothetical protein